MSKLTRRQFNTYLGAGATALAVPFGVKAQAKPKVVVIGGGAAGATAARYIAKDAGDAVDVTLISAQDSYTTCFFSNLYLGDFRSFDSITHSYGKLSSDYGVNVMIGFASGVDRTAKSVKMADGSSVAYDRLVVAPGIDLIYDSVPGYSEEAAEIAPHAWQAGAQTQLLKSKLDGLKNGDNIVMVPPPNPYRCPPGPYERVSMMAHILKSRGMTDSKILVVDPKPKFSKQGLFQEGWEKHYSGMIEWFSPEVHGGITSVDANAGTVETDLDTFEGALLNVIPAQRAGNIASEAGLTDDSGFCPIMAESMRSTVDENVFVIGDASIAGAMPKSGFSANSQAKIAAMNIRADLTGSKAFPAKYSNTCWSLIGTDDGVKVGAAYAAIDGKIASTSKFISATGEDAELRKTTYEESIGWYDGITTDIFG
ncbi:MAG: NAD(P)/FAD-dependent oxidoreductase [Gammaproteobacteria bacterium]|nr:NAD(P)/FAD-dependent oxidoreductase [Gammaproteobacteria bacterium]